MVLRLQRGSQSILLTGDTEHETDSVVAAWVARAQSEILKVAHHGSRTSSSAKILSAVRPEVALISCGIDNKFKHPSPEVVPRYEAQQIRVERTDLAGAIRIDVWDGNYRITPFLARTQTADARDSAHPPLF